MYIIRSTHRHPESFLVGENWPQDYIVGLITDKEFFKDACMKVAYKYGYAIKNNTIKVPYGSCIYVPVIVGKNLEYWYIADVEYKVLD